MLPRAAYVDEKVFAWEQHHFFGGGWMCVGRSEDVAKPGRPAGRSGRARAASCWSAARTGSCARSPTPAATAATSCCRCGASINRRVSPARTTRGAIELDGDLRAAKGFRAARASTPAPGACSRCRSASGTAWSSSTARARPRRSTDGLGDLEEIVAPYETERLRVAGRHEYEVAANWKILTENYHECYHCPVIHPELCQVSPPSSGENYQSKPAPGSAARWTCARAWTPCRSTATAAASRCAVSTPPELRTVIYLNVFPNVLISLHPDYVMFHRLTPLAADRTRIECTWAFAPESVEQRGLRPVVRGRLLGHHQPPGLAGVRVGAARPDLRARAARAAVARRGRGVPVRHDGRARLPRPARPGTLAPPSRKFEG